MTETPEPIPIERKYYFVDEAGDAILIDAHGKVIVESRGCSRFFILGLVDVDVPDSLQTGLTALRVQLLADPYFRQVPSMQPEAWKTALFFHAKDDVPEVCQEVFRLIGQHPVRFSAIVRDKLSVLTYIRSRNLTAQGYRYQPNELYDLMVRRLFKERLHKHSIYRICFARRGRSDRNQALTLALIVARQRFAHEKGIAVKSTIEVVLASPIREASLQVVDYFLWALQRTFERWEDRFLQLLWPQCSVVIDADDSREKGYGRYYTQQRPLTAAALKEAEGYRSEPSK